MFGFGRKMMNLMMKGYVNKARVQYGLPPINDIWEQWMGANVIKITAEAISSAITECVSNDTYKKNAEEISKRLQNVNGIKSTVQLIEMELNSFGEVHGFQDR
jgi:hypothetical protein